MSAAGPTDRLLEVRGLRVRYGGIEAVHGIDLDVERGEIVAIIGANGAGKSSTLLAISGIGRVADGTIRFDGAAIQRSPTHRIASLGLAHVPEGRAIFPRMSVRENLAMGTYALGRDPVESELERIYSLFPILKERQRQPGGTLSGGEQQMLAIGRGLISGPSLLMLDEPSMGLAPILVKGIFDLLRTINAAGVSVLLVEQNARMALQLASRAYVFENGRVVLAERASTLLDDDRVRASYLGSR